MLSERGEGGGERKREGVGEKGNMEDYNKPDLYLPISVSFCKKIFLRDFTTF